jgi:hypothetical protein
MEFMQYAALRPRTQSATRHPRSTFRPEEDFRLRELVRRLGRDWIEVARQMNNRNARQCKERWMNYLSPDVCAQPWTDDDDQLLLQKVAELGPKWVRITSFFPKRTDSNLKNRWFILMRRARRSSHQSPEHEIQFQTPALEITETSAYEPAGWTKPAFLDGPFCEPLAEWDPLGWF